MTSPPRQLSRIPRHPYYDADALPQVAGVRVDGTALPNWVTYDQDAAFAVYRNDNGDLQMRHGTVEVEGRGLHLEDGE